ncbi:MAG: restriction endonuclease subunit S [Sulfitobacter sp.]
MSKLPTGWAEATLDDVTSPRGHKADPQSLGDMPFLGMDHIEAHTSKLLGSQPVRELKSAVAVFKKGDLLYGRLRSYLNKVHLAEFDGAVSAEFIVFPPSEAIEQRFLQSLLRSPDYRVLADQRSTGDRPRVKFDNVSDFEFALPPLPEQKRIVTKLDTLSARTSTARSNLEAIPALVERYKFNFLRSVFRGEQTASFREENDLVPVSALLMQTEAPEQGRGGRKATDEIISGKGGISVNSPETELPKGWDWVPLLRLARQETGHTPSRSHPEWWGGDVRWMSIPDANIHHGKVIYDAIQKTNEAGLANSSARLLPEGTVVLSRTASVGYVTIMGSEMATSQDFATWTCSEALEPKYLMYALLSEGDDIRDFGEGTTHTTIYFPEIRAFNIKLAPLEEQREIVRRIEAAFGMVERLADDAANRRSFSGPMPWSPMPTRCSCSTNLSRTSIPSGASSLSNG